MLYFNVNAGSIKDLSHLSLDDLFVWVHQCNSDQVVLNFGMQMTNSYFESMIHFTIDRWIKWISFLKSIIVNNARENTNFSDSDFCTPIEFVKSTGEVVLLFWDTTTNNTLTFSSLDKFKDFCNLLCNFNYTDY